MAGASLEASKGAAGAESSAATETVSRTSAGSSPARRGELRRKGVSSRGRSGAPGDPVSPTQTEVNPRLFLTVVFDRVRVPGVQVQHVLLEVLGHAPIRSGGGVDGVGAP